MGLANASEMVCFGGQQRENRGVKSDKGIARLAGLLYLMFFVTYVFAVVSHSRFIVPGNATATARNIVASERLFRIGCMSELLSAVLFLLSAWALYVLFVLFNLGGVAIQRANVLNHFAVLILLSGPNYLKVFRADQLQAVAMLLLTVYKNGFMIAVIFYGAWLLPLGYLVFKSAFLPRILGILLIIDGFSVAIWLIQFFFFPDYKAISYPGFLESFVAELSLTLWLLIKGAKDRETGSAERELTT
jgi:hypothetical protein